MSNTTGVSEFVCEIICRYYVSLLRRPEARRADTSTIRRVEYSQKLLSQHFYILHSIRLKLSPDLFAAYPNLPNLFATWLFQPYGRSLRTMHRFRLPHTWAFSSDKMGEFFQWMAATIIFRKNDNYVEGDILMIPAAIIGKRLNAKTALPP